MDTYRSNGKCFGLTSLNRKRCRLEVWKRPNIWGCASSTMAKELHNLASALHVDLEHNKHEESSLKNDATEETSDLTHDCWCAGPPTLLLLLSAGTHCGNPVYHSTDLKLSSSFYSPSYSGHMVKEILRYENGTWGNFTKHRKFALPRSREWMSILQIAGSVGQQGHRRRSLSQSWHIIA